MLFGDEVLTEDGLQLPRADILQYGFALKPLADIARGLSHPVTGKTYAALWAGFKGEGRDLRVVSFAID